MIDLKEIHSFTEFQRNAKAFAERIRESKKPMVLTINGKAALVIQDAESYQELLDTLEQTDVVSSIHQAIQERERGKGRPVEEFLAEMKAKYNLPDKP